MKRTISYASIKIIIILSAITLVIACGGSESNTETAVESDPNISKIIGTWHLPEGCSFGPETVSLSIFKNSTSENNISIAFSYFEEDTRDFYYQSLSNIDVIDSIVSIDGSTSFYLKPELITNSGGINDLFISEFNEALRFSNNKLLVFSVCASLNESSFIQNTNISDASNIRLLRESTAIREYYKSEFDNDWTAIYVDLLDRGLIGSSLVCSMRAGLVDEYLGSLLLALFQNELKFSLFSLDLTNNWSNQSYQVLYDLDLQELPLPDEHPWSLSNCDPSIITNKITTSYTIGSLAIIN